MLFIHKKKPKALSLSLFTHHCHGMASTHEQSEPMSILTAHLHTMHKKKKENNCHISGATSSALPLMLATAMWAMKMRHGRELTDKTWKAATITLALHVTGVGGQESEEDSSPLELLHVCFLTWQPSEISILIFLTSADTKRESEQAFDEHVSCGRKCNLTLLSS